MGPLRFDGLYLRESRPDLIGWFRFYADGAVLSVSTTPGPPAQVASWLRPAHPHVSRGRWSLDGARLTFTATSPAGSVDYEGEAHGDELVLSLHSHINGHQSQGVWAFRALDAHALDGPTSPGDFHPIRSYKDLAKAGVGDGVIAALRKARAVTLTNVNHATPEELAAWASIDPEDARRICAWRDGHDKRRP